MSKKQKKTLGRIVAAGVLFVAIIAVLALSLIHI